MQKRVPFWVSGGSSRATAVVVLLVACAAGCSKRHGPATLRDTEGRTFDAKCERSGDCTIGSSLVARPSGAKPSGGEPAWVLLRQGRYYGACETWKGHDPEPWDCRAIVCQSDANCPAIEGVSTGTCMHGLCGDPARDVSTPDAVLLCLAGTGPGHETTAQLDRYAMAAACGSPCKVPTPCRQP